MASTYEPINTYTISGSAASAVTFTSIPSTYTDLRVVINGADSGGYLILKVNNDGSAVYSRTNLIGNGTAMSSGRATGNTSWFPDLGNNMTNMSTSIIDIFSYCNTNVYKTALQKVNSPSNSAVGAWIWLWRSTSAINSLYFTGSSGASIAVGTTFTIYGIAAA